MLTTIWLLLFVGTAFCLQVIPETTKVKYINDKYLEDVVFNVRRHSRNSPYYFNLYATIKHTWTNNVTIHVILTQYLHNEYRRSFIEIHSKFCDLINDEPYIGGMLRDRGVSCPALKGKYKIQNMTVQTSSFPNVWPFEKGGADIEFTVTDTGECISKTEVHMKFVQKKIG